jgi:hypothetical protein
MVRLGNIPLVFTQEFRHWKKIEFFRTVLYVFLLLNALSLLPIAREMWHYYGISGTRGWNTDASFLGQGSYGFLNVLSHPANSYMTWVYKAFVAGQMIFLVTGILRIFPVISSVMIYFFTVNLNLKGYLCYTGGEALINLILFYLMFIHCRQPSGRSLGEMFKPKFSQEPGFSPVNNLLNNTFYWIMLLQICVVYVFSTLFKLLDDYWLSGEALMYISRIDAFSSGAMKSLFGDSPGLSAVFTWLSLLYQLLFPILVWVKRIKIPFLIGGVLMHLSIAFGMGIFTFGIVMIIMYILFLNEGQIEKLKKFLRRPRFRKSVSL